MHHTWNWWGTSVENERWRGLTKAEKITKTLDSPAKTWSTAKSFMNWNKAGGPPVQLNIEGQLVTKAAVIAQEKNKFFIEFERETWTQGLFLDFHLPSLSLRRIWFKQENQDGRRFRAGRKSWQLLRKVRKLCVFSRSPHWIAVKVVRFNVRYPVHLQPIDD